MKYVFPNLNGDAVARVLNELPNTRAIPVVLYNQGGAPADEARLASPQSGIRRYVLSDDPQVLLSAVTEVLAYGTAVVIAPVTT